MHNSIVEVSCPTAPCDREQLKAPPCGLVIFGASGDLTARKLIPAVYQLFEQGFLDSEFFVLGAARTDLDDVSFRKRMERALAGRGRAEDRRRFLKLLYYQRLDYSSAKDYSSLAERIKRLHGLDRLLLFHLALPPDLHGTVAAGLGGAGLNIEEGGVGRRLVVEKPFGYDLESARRLCRELWAHFKEAQIYRIDHYLAKETVQNLLVFRLANSIFEPLWNQQHIERIEIRATETVGVGNRAGYYDKVGVLRDMMQNHMMQLLALAAMEPPASLEAERIRDEKVKVYRQLRPMYGRIDTDVVLGQYGPGKIDGRSVPGYRQEPGVAADSLTPTFAAFRVYIDSWRWGDVPFLLVSGKRLAEKQTEIRVHFRKAPLDLFGSDLPANQLVFDIHPRRMIELHFQSKQPGPKLDTRQVVMRFGFALDDPGSELGDYARVILDALRGEQTLFWRQDGIELCWQYLEHLLVECESCPDRGPGLHVYPAGSKGPDTSILGL